MGKNSTRRKYIEKNQPKEAKSENGRKTRQLQTRWRGKQNLAPEEGKWGKILNEMKRKEHSRCFCK